MGEKIGTFYKVLNMVVKMSIILLLDKYRGSGDASEIFEKILVVRQATRKPNLVAQHLYLSALDISISKLDTYSVGILYTSRSIVHVSMVIK